MDKQNRDEEEENEDKTASLAVDFIQSLNCMK